MGVSAIIRATLKAMEAEDSPAIATPELRESVTRMLESLFGSLHAEAHSLEDVLKDIDEEKWDYWSAWVRHFHPDPEDGEE